MKKKNLMMLGMALFTAFSLQAEGPNLVDWTVIRSEGDAWDLDMTAGGSLVWGDYNNDGYMDAFANMGYDRAHLYENKGGKFAKVQEGKFTGLKESYSVFIDYNNDGYLDLVTTGKADGDGDKKMTVFYKNTGKDGNYAFVVDEENSAVIPGMVSGDGDRVGHLLCAVDIDNDGWVDLVVNGNIDTSEEKPHPLGITGTGRFTAVYKNVNGKFSVMKDNVVAAEEGGDTNFAQMAGGSVHVGDYNNDGFPDIVNIGYNDRTGYASALYKNNGDGTFTKVNYELDKNEKCDIVFADINGDGYDDIIEITGNVANIHISKGDDTFEKLESAVTGLVKSQAANITVGDVNNDGYNDIFTSGYDIPNFTSIFYNNGDNTFTTQQINPGSRPGTANFVDMNNDLNLDASYYGWSNGEWPNRFMRNDLGENVKSNTAPTTPINFAVSYADGKYSLTWDKATDEETPQDALRYNIFAYNNDNDSVYAYAPVNLVSGKLKIGGGIIPLISKNSFELNIAEGNYTFGVQAVDQANATSTFATNVATTNQVNWTIIRSEGENWDLDMTYGGSLVWGDYNNDGYVDAFANMGNERVHLYRNNGDGTFDKIQEGEFTGLTQGYSVFIDYNNDGYLDLVATGKANGDGDKKMTIFYKNTGEEGEFKLVVDEVNSAAIPGMVSGDDERVGHLLSAVDIDNDGWIDLVVNGNIDTSEENPHPLGITGTGRFTAVYKNINGVFSIMKDNVVAVEEGDDTNFAQMAGGAVHTGDYNNDGFPDIVNMGYSDKTGYSSALYKNNGDGTFTKIACELDKNEKCDVIFADINGDGYDDIIEITGNVGNIHLSNGDDTFEKLESATTGLVKSQATNITVGDVNNDGYNDILVSGYDIPGYTAIYYNNGDNTFTPKGFDPGARPGTTNFVDMNNDLNLDVSYYGWGGDWRNRFLRNDLGIMVASNSAPVAPEGFTVSYSLADGKYSLSWEAGFDVETAEEALRYNIYAKNEETGVVYTYAPADLATGRLKVGGGIIPLLSNTSFEWNLPEADYTFGVQTVDQAAAASAFATTGYIAPYRPKQVEWEVIKDETGENGLPMTFGGALIWGDYNNDGQLDAFFSNKDNFGQLYKNEDGVFTNVLGEEIPKLTMGSSVFIDYNNDGNLDLIVCGKDGNTAKTLVYKNTGSAGNYQYELDAVQTAALHGIHSDNEERISRMLNAVDYDNDGWVDLIVSGNLSVANPYGVSGQRFVGVYKNVNGTFELQQNVVDGTANMDQIASGSIHVGDFNNDGNKDVVIVGWSDSAAWTTALYKNNGDGTFTKIDNALDPNESCETVFADINGDGYDDMIEINNHENAAYLHISNGDGTFTKLESSDTGLEKTVYPSITVGDVNNDGYNDIMITGNDIPGWTAIYYNDGSNQFTKQNIQDGGRPGKVNLVDMTGDGNLDLNYYGWSNGNWPNRFMENKLGEGIVSNTAPAVPTNLAVNYADGKFELSWDKSTDAETPQDALRYNIYMLNKSNNAIYAYAPVNIETGKLKISGSIVPLIAKNSMTLTMPDENYTIGVQAVDQADIASEFITVDYKKLNILNVEKGSISAYSAGQSIVIKNNSTEMISYSVISLGGQVIASGKCSADSQNTVLGVAPGAYIVKTSVGIIKVLVL